jgi:uncharacterized repeat protein (TIGR03803 family)
VHSERNLGDRDEEVFLEDPMKTLTIVTNWGIALACFVVLVGSPSTTDAQCTRNCSAGGAGSTPAFVTLHRFTGGADGGQPEAGLIQGLDGNLYGTTEVGGAANFGVVFKLDATGKETVLHSFMGGADGAHPRAGLVLDSAGNLYGTTFEGGAGPCNQQYPNSRGATPLTCGIVFKLDASGTESVLHSFTGEPDGANPSAGLVLDATGNLYGTTSYGGTLGFGMVFKLDASDVESVLHSFTSSDGANPSAALIQDAEGNLYGTTSRGGTFGSGTVFKLDTTSTETVLYSFMGAPTDGANPAAGLVRDATGNLFGTTVAGGDLCYIIAHTPPTPSTFVNCGIVFRLDTTGKETLLYRFTGPPDGAIPRAGLVLDAAGNLYGTTSQGGAGSCIILSGGETDNLGCGSIFKLDPNGNETVLFSFSGAAGTDWGPQASLTLDAAGNLFGTTSRGGAGCGGLGCGGLFQLSAGIAPPQVSTPTFSPPGGTYTSIQSVTISDSTADSAIYYTTDSSAPTTSSIKYVGAITVGASDTLNAVAVAAGFSNSAIATAAYTISAPDFMLSPAFTNLTVQPGGQGADVITIAPQNGAFGNPVRLSCSVIGPQPLPTCLLSPTSVTPGTASPTSILTITAPSGSAMLVPSAGPLLAGPLNGAWISLVIVAVILLPGSKKEPRRYVWPWCCFILVLMQAACGGGSSTVQHSSQNFTVTVTGSSSMTASPAIQHSTQVTVTVP